MTLSSQYRDKLDRCITALDCIIYLVISYPNSDLTSLGIYRLNHINTYFKGGLASNWIKVLWFDKKSCNLKKSMIKTYGHFSMPWKRGAIMENLMNCMMVPNSTPLNHRDTFTNLNARDCVCDVIDVLIVFLIWREIRKGDPRWIDSWNNCFHPGDA